MSWTKLKDKSLKNENLAVVNMWSDTISQSKYPEIHGIEIL